MGLPAGPGRRCFDGWALAKYAHPPARPVTGGCARSDSSMPQYWVMGNNATTPNAIEATGLITRFGKPTALDGVDLVARQGRVLGVLGPNGAGKTTAVRILATLLRPDGGRASVCGYDVLRDAHQVRQLIGLTGQYASVDEGLSGTNNLIMIGRLLGLPRPDARPRAGHLLARFDLAGAAARPA